MAEHTQVFFQNKTREFQVLGTSFIHRSEPSSQKNETPSTDKGACHSFWQGEIWEKQQDSDTNEFH